jgi:CcmD family protein
MVLVTRITRILALVLLLAGGGTSIAHAQPTSTPQGPATTAAQEEYVPIDQLPESEKLPAAPFLIAAYIVVWAALLVYVLSLWRRLGRVEADLREARRTSGAR